ncbi:hypothetical protein DXT99_14110 [Pontibacter diazotrophicus]|uniref:Uncharacterized protein n=1 Tax=Pontibacter diazotrophicus TaxID=1400979 RepID=A0A3D8LAR8_9BACT|nr:hypothetical protein [Pontibacter diazotrophicus]RDV14531.1 hypothetical protein DXT99_14110 [Pontibacter diazotrophicus]
MDKLELINGLTEVIESKHSKLSSLDLKKLKEIRKELSITKTKEEMASVVLKRMHYLQFFKEILNQLVEFFREPPS